MNYLNTKPLVYGLEAGAMKDSVELSFDYPANIAALLANDHIDVGLIPVAAIHRLPEYYIITDHCIGCTGQVASVCLFSDVPLEKIENILLDYQSRTSAALLKILIREHWKISPGLVDTERGFESMIGGTTAGLVIGDRALRQRAKSAFIYDLGEHWIQMTGLPFVFAAWVANKKMPEDFISSFNDACATGMDHIDEIVEANPFADYDLDEYYHRNISYNLDAAKRKGLSLFLEKIRENG